MCQEYFDAHLLAIRKNLTKNCQKHPMLGTTIAINQIVWHVQDTTSPSLDTTRKGHEQQLFNVIPLELHISVAALLNAPREINVQRISI